MKIVLIILLGLFSSGEVIATINVPTMSLSDITNGINSATNGEIVNLPAGTCHYTNTINITKSILLTGLTTVSGSYSNPTVNRLTIFSYDRNPDPVISNPANGDPSFELATTNGVVQITGCSFTTPNDTNLTGKTLFGCVIHVAEGTPTFRIHHNDFFTLNNQRALWASNEKGCMDHNVATNLIQSFTEPHRDDYGDLSYSTPALLGTDLAIFYENNYVQVQYAKKHVQGFCDGSTGARWVVRYNYCDGAHITTHGTESGGRNRGPRTWEIYNNYIRIDPFIGAQANAMFFRGGSGVVHDNTLVGNFGNAIRLINYRDNQGVSPQTFTGVSLPIFKIWWAANGTNDWDLNDVSDQTGNGFGGNTNGIFASGTASVTGSILTVAGNPWTPNQWFNYSVKNVTTGTNQNPSNITGNTSNTLSYMSVSPLVWTNGDSFEIRKVIFSLDHIGAGQSDFMGGGSSPTHRWLNQVLEPAYFWNNTLNGGNANIFTESNLTLGRDYYATSKPGYTPFVYPHPLVSGSPVTNATLFVTSVNPSSTVPIVITPIDNNGNSNGPTPVLRTYTTNIVVTNIAPSTVGTTVFQKWQKDGVDYSTNLTVIIEMDSSHTLNVVYVGTGSPPITAFHGSPVSGNKPLGVNFVDDTGNATSWFWTFGDGEHSTLQNVLHTYGSLGSYTVSLLTANDTGTNTLTKVNYITVNNIPGQKGSKSREKPLLDLP